MTMAPTLPTPPKPTLPGRSLRARWRLTMIVGMNALILLVVACAVLITALEERQSLIRLHAMIATQVDAAAQNAVTSLQTALTSAGTDPAALERLRALNPALARISVVAVDGHTVAVVPDSEPRDWGDALALEAVLASHDSFQSIMDGELVLAVPAPDGAGAIIAEADPQQFFAAALTTIRGSAGYAYFVTEDGALLATVPGQTVDTGVHPADFALLRDVLQGGEGTRLYKGLAGRWVVGHAEHATSAGFIIIAETSLSTFATPVVRLVGLWGLALVLTAAVGEWLIRRNQRTVSSPLHALQTGAHAVAGGDYRYRLRMPADTDREFVELAAIFNQMVERLASSQKQIDAYSQDLQELVDQRARELARKASELERATGITRALAPLLDPRLLTDRAIDLICERFGVYHAEVLLVDTDTNAIVPAPSYYKPARERLLLQDAPHSVIAWVGRHGQLYYVPDTTREPRYLPSVDAPASRCALIIPMHFEGSVIGVLNLEADHRDAFTRDEMEVLSTLADEIGAAMHNAQAFTALETANRDLAQATLHANQANTLKSRFLNSAAHRLRGPLNTMIGYSETMLSGVYGALPEPVLERQRYVVDQGRGLQALIEDMFDLSTIETGEMQLNYQWVRLTPLLEEIMNAARALHQAGYADHDLTLRLDLMHLTAPLPPLWVDLDRLRYMLMTLMSNAVKFTPAGEIVVSAHCDDDTIHISVRDTGPGISEDRVRYVFEPFQHKRGEPESDERGTGLGLSVSRLLAMRHGGDLTVTSTIGQGSTFTLSLPRQAHGAPPPPEDE